jgi:hypothetical protein
MKPFSTIAIPHRDILEGRLTMDVFAADLWEVFKGRAQAEYQDRDLFFSKTFITAGLKNLLDIAEKRLKGAGGDPIIQLHTPFGGGKTHTLIALYHKAKEWNAQAVVIDGTAIDPKEIIIWEEIERQLTGKVDLLKGKTSPGREKLREVLKENQPILILMDETLEYVTKAAGIKVGDSNLASQFLAFIQELTGVIKTFGNSVLVLTLTSNILEHYDETAERLFQQMQKIVGRMEKIYTPVQDEEISQIIRRRLFSVVDEKKAKKTIDEFLDYAEEQKMLPDGVEKASYRDRFIKSFPFQPEVIDVLYKRWGSFPTFQRTRGVLRILALVVHSLKDSKVPFIRLGDINLTNEDIRRELIKYTGQEFDGIIAQDITSSDAGAKKVDAELGAAYSAFSFGTKAATAIFMYSFSGGAEKGAGINEIKLACADTSAPSSIVAEAVTKLKDNLFYISDVGLFFTNQTPLNRILLTIMERIEDFKSEEKALLTKSLTKEYFDIYIWPNNPKDISDTTKFKLVILTNRERCKEFLENCGERPRVYRNTLIFLCPLESERINFENFLKKKLAWELIEKEKTLRLTDEQKKKVKEKIKEADTEAKDRIKGLYRIILLPSKNEFKEIDLGIPTYGKDFTIDKEVYERLRSDGDVLEKLSALILKEKYLKEKDYVETQNIYESFLKTPGEIRIKNVDVLKDSIKEGVKQGLFGIGELENENPICRHFKEEYSPEIVEREIIIKAELCIPKQPPDGDYEELINKINECDNIAELMKIEEEISKYNLSSEQRQEVENKLRRKREELTRSVKPKEIYHNINLRLNVPQGKLSDIMGIVNYVKTKFKQVDIRIEIIAKDGELTKSEYENSVKEALKQAEVQVESENLQ